MKKLVIIDGKSVFYRGYYAMGALATSDGTPTGGVYGFAAIAMELIRRIRPDKVAVAWDKAGTSISKRKMIYSEYKAGRKRPPEDFVAQIPLLRELVEALSWGFLECDNYEADDIIGTLSLQADEEGDYETIIVSSDLDMLQVVDENTKMYRLLRGFSRLEEIDVSAIEEKYGILKSQFLDLKALKGDTSDNIPGVPGIGEKGAVKLLNEYGSLDGIYEHIDEISGSVHDKLVAGRESAYMSYKLGKIMTDAPVELSEVPELRIDGPKIVAALQRLEFNSLIKKFRKELGVEATLATGHAAADSSTGALEMRAPVGASPVAGLESATPDPLPEGLIVDDDIKRLMHRNAKVTEKILGGAEFWDLNQGAFLLDPLRRKVEKKQEGLPFETEEDVLARRREFWRQKEEFAKEPKLLEIYRDFDLPMIPVLYKMEDRGIGIDRQYFANLTEEYSKQVAELEKKIFEVSGAEFNLNSPAQLSRILFERLKLPTKGIKKSSRGYSTGATELLKLRDAHPVVPMIMEYREASKLLSTYIVPLPAMADMHGRIHTTFTQDVTATGRLSSVAPNLQNIPVRTEEGKRIRTGFVAPSGRVFVSADYSQFELRLAAVLSGDTALIEDFNSGIDIHTKTAADVFGVPFDEVTPEQRRAAKVINFGVLYGMSAKGLSVSTGMSVAEASAFIRDYFEVRRPIREYLDAILRQAREEGYVETYFGRRRPTPDVRAANFLVRSGAERAAQNMPIQGTEADLMKRAMIRLDSALPEGAELLMQVHDSVIVECPAGEADEVSGVLRSVMEGVAPELKIKLAVDVKVGRNWGEV